MDALTFHGHIEPGVGRYSKMTIPGRAAFPDAPNDWPETLQPGSLNVKISADGYPKELLSRCNGELVQKLDSQMLSPEFEIPRNAIQNNKLKPKPDKPRGGDAQVWRASLIVPNRQVPFDCWVLRRFGSRIREQLEIVSDIHLRTELGLVNGTAVVVHLYGTWNAA